MKRVKQISFDVLVDENIEGCQLAEDVANFLDENDYIVLGADFKGDITDTYINEYGGIL